MNTKVAFAGVIEECYALQIKNINHKITSGSWTNYENRSSILLEIKPIKKVLFKNEDKPFPDRLLRVAINILICYEKNRILFIMDSYPNCSSISNFIRAGEKALDFPEHKRERLISELVIIDTNMKSKVKRRFNSLFKKMLKNFSLVDKIKLVNKSDRAKEFAENFYKKYKDTLTALAYL